MTALDLHCLLCSSEELSVSDHLTAEEILRLWARGGIRFLASAVQPLVEKQTVRLYRCDKCGFQFFDPKLAGGAEFYEQLSAQTDGYYAPDRPENERNARFAVEHGFRTILDIGCGTGYALDTAKRSGLETYGIELSRTAAEIAAARGHTVFQTLVEDLDSKWNGRFDLISMNQLLEHVPDPVGVVKNCVRLLSPRGVIAIAVPSATGILRFRPWLEANWPPHHISRWRNKDFRTLANSAGLRLLKTGGNRLFGREIEHCLLEHRQDCALLNRPYHGPPKLLVKTIAFIYRKTGAKYVFNSQGHSIYCYLTRL